MKLLRYVYLFVFSCSCFSNFSQIKLCSWNLENFGRSKSDSAILFISRTIKDFDVVAIVEVVAGNGGAQAVARLADELNRLGNKWDYCISDPTSGAPNKSERYAFLWKTSKLKKKGDAWLEKKFAAEIEQEPYLATFITMDREFTVAAFHAIPKGKQPETEIKFFKFLPNEYSDKTLIFCGDFNCPESHSVFGPLKNMNYKASLIHQKTSLKKECVSGECLASEYDNLFYPAHTVKSVSSGVILFYKNFASLRSARSISDHLPVYLEFDLIGTK